MLTVGDWTACDCFAQVVAYQAEPAPAPRLLAAELRLRLEREAFRQAVPAWRVCPCSSCDLLRFSIRHD
jgi:hypothetical protein